MTSSNTYMFISWLQQNTYPALMHRLGTGASLVLLLQLLLVLTSGRQSTADHASYDARRPQSTASSRANKLQQHVQSLLHKCPLPGYCSRDQGLPSASQYLSSSPAHIGMQRQREIITNFLAGSGFQARLQQLQQLPDRQGILISAGKPHHIGNAAVMLHVLRRQYNCTLPVEIAHRGDAEVDKVTRATLAEAFAPLRWLDLNQQPYPAHHNQAYTMDRYEPKIYALYHTSFQQVLMLDADNMPLKDPSYLFDSPHMGLHGAMMWLDLWSPELSSTTFVGHDSVYSLVGLNKQAYWDALAGGQGHVRRVAESGQLVLDRVRHADVLEWLWMYTSFSADLYRHILGDKDTFGYAFATAGKLHDLHAVAVPPGIALARTPKADGQLDWWHFHAMTQYDHVGGVIFFHRTLEKWMDVRKMPTIMDVQTGPLPNWFILSYLGNSSSGLTPDMPGHVLQPLAAPPSCSSKTPTSTFLNRDRYTTADPLNLNFGRRRGGCPFGVYLQLLELRGLGLPVSATPKLEVACRRHVALKPHGLRVLQSDSRELGASELALSEALQDSASDTGRGITDENLTSDPRDGSSSSSSDVAESFFHLLNERVWLRNCMVLRKRTVTPTIDSSSASRNSSSASRLGGDVGRKLLGRPVAAEVGRSTALSSSSSSKKRHHRRKQEKSSIWPKCTEVQWHVARYMLPENAQQVGRDANGQPMSYVAAVLPVLQLVSSSSPFDPVTVVSAHLAPAGAASMSCGCGSLVDVMQRVSLPAAVQWVNDNIKKLPYLNT